MKKKVKSYKSASAPKSPSSPKKLALKRKEIEGKIEQPISTKTKTPSDDEALPQPINFPIVGIGASAGGLETFQILLSNIPSNTGMAFIIIQHLDPNHESMTSDILGRSTKMPVIEIKNDMLVVPNHVYVIPSNCNLSLVHGLLKILPRTEIRGLHLPIDFFFKALAEELNTQAIGVVLSGTASDGTQGLRAIKSEGGITLVQDPKTAKYDGMPKSAIASGAVDLIKSPKRIAEELVRISKHPYVAPQRTDYDHGISEYDSLARIFSLLQKSTNIDFSYYKKSTIQRRIARRMLLKKTDNLANYARILESDRDEIKELFADILIHVTAFFRDKKAFETLKTQVLPKYMKNRDNTKPFRIWVPGCSTGEEVYSLAMTLMEFQEESKEYSQHNLQFSNSLTIFATDISEQALKKARAAIYPESISKEISKERLARFFENADGGGYRVAKFLRDICLFSKHDVTRDPPFAKVDLISCRNVLIYFNPELQKNIIPIFHYALNPDGILFLGKSDGIAGFSHLFSILDKTNKIYSKINVTTPLRLQFPLTCYPVERLEPAYRTAVSQPYKVDLKRELEKITLSEYSPPCVVINDAFEIVQSQGNTSPFLRLSSGQASLNFLRMADSDLVADLRMMIQDAYKKSKSVIRRKISFNQDGKQKAVTIKVVPIPTPSESKERYLTIFFETVEEPIDEQTKKDRKSKQSSNQGNHTDERILEMQKKLSTHQEYQQALIEEYETSQGELISFNEELQSTNEELQSTNEELETAKEELQSTNEELTTVNDEMQTRNAEMIQLNDDLKNLLASVDIPIVMVGSDGKIRRFTPKAGKVLKLVPSDVGRSIGDIKPNIQISDLDQLVSEVIDTMTMREMETQDSQGYLYNLQVRPYRTIDNKIDGAVIALVDVDLLKRTSKSLKQAVESLIKARDDAASIIESQPIPLMVIDQEKRIKSANAIFYENFKLTCGEVEGKLLSELDSGLWNIPELQAMLDEILIKGLDFQNFELKHEFSQIGVRNLLLSARKVNLIGSNEIAILLIIEDVTERLKMAQTILDSEEKYRNLIASAHDGILIIDDNGKIELINERIEKMFGYSSGELVGQSIDMLRPDRFKQIDIEKQLEVASQPDLKGDLDLFGKHKNGTEFSIDLSLSPLKTSKGMRTTVIIRDISERKEIEKERMQLLMHEQEMNHLKDEFLATLSHELRTPLSTIINWIHLLRKGELGAEKSQYGMEIVEKCAKAQGQLIDDLLDISRIEAGKFKLIIQKIDPSQVVLDTINSIHDKAESKSIQIVTEIDPSVTHMYADPSRLQQIMSNLITNSIKFSPKNGKIWIAMDRINTLSDEFFRIQVRDNGKGIQAKFILSIFDRFTQVDSSSTRPYGGLGLGLAIVRKLVEMHGGSVSVESPGENKGATFTVLIPVIPIGNIEIPEEIKLESNTAIEEGRLHGLRLLLVDDDFDGRNVVNLILESFGAEVKTAESAKEAISILKSFKPDVLISDIAMPVEDGYSLIAKVRGLKSPLAKMPAIALTAYAGLDESLRIQQAGFQCHLAKPVDAMLLVLTIFRLAQAIDK